MSTSSSNILLILIGGVLLAGMFYAFFIVLFSKDKYAVNQKNTRKAIKPEDKNTNS